MELPSGQSLYSYCSNISMEDVHKLVLMRGLTGMACFTLCLISLMLEIIYLRLSPKKGSTTLQRFFVYVIVANLLRSALLSMDVFSHKDSLNVNERLCEAIGFLSQYCASFQLLTIITLMFLLFHNLFTLNPKYKQLSSRFHFPHMDTVVIVFLFLLPSLYTWVPFVIDGGVYGDAGPWCWLKAFANDSNCTEISSVFILESVLWNIPFGVVLVFCLVCVSLYLALFVYIGFCRIITKKNVKTILVDTCILFLFFALYTILCIIEISALMFADKTSSSYSWLVLYSVTLPIGEISLSLSSFVRFFRLCKSWIPGRVPAMLRHDSISKLLSEDEIVGPSSRCSVPSYTSQQERPALLSPSTAEWTSVFSETNRKYGTLEP